jgi:hypothetical protein
MGRQQYDRSGGCVCQHLILVSLKHAPGLYQHGSVTVEHFCGWLGDLFTIESPWELYRGQFIDGHMNLDGAVARNTEVLPEGHYVIVSVGT